MRKSIGIAVIAAALGLQLVPAQAGGAQGTVLLPTVTVPTQGLFTRQARCAQLLGLPNGVFGHYTQIAANQDNRPFTLSGSADFDVVFYASLGTCENMPASEPLNDTAFVGPGNESGTVPNGARHAIIVFEAPAAPNQSFTFAIN